ncbi:DNA primase [Campylobacter corcagiensis]|uniref:DNA primase n=1 Tax=Campylobacter corcagiensis TaxID=1448857 RepID=A0A7M1LJ30_9BACT|nr:DNA primase [Campylobacter corcagiensis]QOQ87944.1 DNA primase [Campylobacter corcagiensis]
MIKQESIDRLLEVTDIVDVVSQYVNLKRSGRNFVGLCPFHDDRNPSMSVSQDMGIYHCFSCKAGGNAINFIKEYEHLSYPEAIEKLANMQGFTLEYTKDNINKKHLDIKILDVVNGYYKFCLYQNHKALDYLYKRGFDDALIDKFELGYAPASHYTTNLLENEGIDKKDALEVGIIKQNENGVYASFIERITFPIKNHTGKLVGFGGRTITNHPAKYVNSPESVVFDKSRIFYAYDKAKDEIHKKGEILITEGYMDTIMLHKAKFSNAVAVLGTALTQKHLPLIRRSGAKVVLMFDGDGAGKSAAYKSSVLLMKNKIDASVVIIPDGADPADLVQAGEVLKLDKILNTKIEAGEFVIKNIANNFELARPLQKQKALEEIQKFTKELPMIVANSYQNLVANLLGVDIGSFSLTQGKFTPNAKQDKRANLTPKKDYLELQILKTLAVDKEIFNSVKNSIRKDYFITHYDIWEAIFENSPDGEILVRELEIDDSVDEFKEVQEFFKALKLLIIANYKKRLNLLKISSDPDKFAKMNAIQNSIRKLEKDKI